VTDTAELRTKALMVLSEDKRDGRFEFGRHTLVALAQGVLDLITERDNAQEKLTYLRNEWSPFSARPCPACVYDNGRYIRACKLHEHLDWVYDQKIPPSSADTAAWPSWLVFAVRMLHSFVDQTDPNCPIGTALTRAGLERCP
jgi:hypothetical protein